MITLVGNIGTSDGKNFLTAVNGGDLGPNAEVAVNTNRTVASSWETFTLLLQPGSPPIGPNMKFALQTSSGVNYLTATNGGGIGGPNDATSPVHTDQTVPGPWETFVLHVNDNANPPTVQIMSYKSNSGPYFLTAVNGGGIGDGGTNKAPIHTDAKTIEAWEHFSFSGSVVKTGPLTIAGNTNVNINNPLGGVLGNIAGSYLITLNSNGAYQFSCQANNSVPFISYDYVLAVVVIGADKTAYSFGARGTIGSTPFGNNNLNLGPTSGNNATIEANWAKSIGQNYGVYWNASATMDLEATLQALVGPLQTAGQIVGDVIQVVAELAG